MGGGALCYSVRLVRYLLGHVGAPRFSSGCFCAGPASGRETERGKNITIIQCCNIVLFWAQRMVGLAHARVHAQRSAHAHSHARTDAHRSLWAGEGEGCAQRETRVTAGQQLLMQ